MNTFMTRLPNGLTISLSTLLCASVVLLQQAGSYASKLEEAVGSISVDAALAALPDMLRTVGGVTGTEALNAAEQSWLNSLLAWVAPEAQDDAALEDEVNEETPPAPRVEIAAEDEPAGEAASVAVADAVADAEPVEEVAVEEVAVEVSAAAETPDSAAEPERELVPAPGSAWWPMVTAVLTPRNFADRALANSAAHTEMYLARRASAEQPIAEQVAELEPAVEQAAAEPVPEVAAEQTAPDAQPPAEETAEPEPAPAASTLVVAPTPDSEPPVVAQTPPMRCRIMMVGDSLMEDLGPRTHKQMSKRKGLEFIISAKYSTGLCRPDYFNWPNHLREQVEKRSPDLVVFFIGANDGQPIKEGRHSVYTGGPAWKEAYMRKMDEVIGIVRGAGADVIWVELPAIGGRYAKLLHDNQIAQREYCETHGITTLLTDPLFSGEWGKFEAFGSYHGRTVRLRRKDLTHLSPEGNMKVLEHLMPIIEQRLTAFYKAHPERHLSEAEVAQIKSVPAVYTCKYTPPKKKPRTTPAAESTGTSAQ